MHPCWLPRSSPKVLSSLAVKRDRREWLRLAHVLHRTRFEFVRPWSAEEHQKEYKDDPGDEWLLR